MPYIGHAPTNSGNFYILDDFNGLGQNGSSSTYDQNANGTIVNFKLMVAGVAITPNVDNLIVTIDGVLQHPTDAYTISGSILTFTGAPASGVDFHVVIMGQSSTVGEGSIGADELQVSGDGTNNQLLKSDGDGTMSWINQNTVTASTAATLATARAINGVNFDGSAAITVTADANTLSNTTLKSTVVSSSLTSVGTIGTGVWQGTKVASAYLDDDTAHLSGSTFTGTVSLGDLDIIPTSSNVSVIKHDSGSGSLTLQGDQVNIKNRAGDETGLSYNDGGGVTFGGNITTSEDKRISIGTWDNSGFTGANAYGLSIDSQLPIIHMSDTDTNKKAFFGLSGDNMYIGGNPVDAMIFQTGSGVERMRINSSGNVGIGLSTTSVNNKFQVQVGTDHRIGFWGSSSYSAIQSVNDANTAQKPLRFDATTYSFYGSSTTWNHSPEISASDSSTSATFGLKITNISSTSDTIAGIIFKNYDNNAGWIRSIRTGSAEGVLLFGTNTGGGIAESNITEKMRITSGGLVTIGTSGFGSAGTNLKQLGTAWSTSTGWSTTDTGTFTGIAISNPHPDGGTACGIQFSHHAGSSGVSYIVSRAERAYSSGGDRSSLHFGTRGSDGVQRRMIIGDSGVITMSNVYGRAVGSTKRAVYVGDGGDLGYDSSVREHKMDIKSLSDVTWLSDLNPVSFYRRKIKQDGTYGKTKDGSIEYGLIADEVEKVNKDFVFYDIDEDENKVLAGVEYRQLMIPMLKKIQELEAKVTSLENA